MAGPLNSGEVAVGVRLVAPDTTSDTRQEGAGVQPGCWHPHQPTLTANSSRRRPRTPLSGRALACDWTRSAREQGRVWRGGSLSPPCAGQASGHALLAEVNRDHLMSGTGRREPPIKPELPPEPHRPLLCPRLSAPRGGQQPGWRDLCMTSRRNGSGRDKACTTALRDR